MKRRAALQSVAALGAGAVVSVSLSSESFSGVHKVLDHTVDVDEWDQAVHEYGQRIMTQPTGALVNNLTADILRVSQCLDRTQDLRDRAGLMRVSAGLSGLLAIEMGDVGDTRAARVSWSAARHAADASGDCALRVWVRGRAAEDAHWAGRTDQVVTDLADEAIGIAAGKPSPGLARAHAARAAVAASRGDDKSAIASIRRINETFERLSRPTDEQSVLSYRESQLRWAESFVFTRLGDRRAESVLAQALALYPVDAQGPITNLKLMQAAALVREGDADSGLRHAVTIIQHRPDAVTAGTRLLARQILRALPDRGRTLPAARELRALTSVA
ncbi:XRE family transcriptional regulator [Actinomadura graeca]|uniref:XRE family transcriptional regulator n=1 Tax=Actinomadura graeca TaxID=2750812 RepID=A0ABX8QSM5_9ACTN|nr:XRE family transcriptional regulator [Actinomadura graeca]QXJ21633.1 XRE family transcriptional regulator [Actinomadura graeca]